jgi:hypothetical protein
MESFALNFSKMTYDMHGAGPDVSDHGQVRMMGWDNGLGAP